MAYFLNSCDVNQTFIIEPLVIDDITVTAATYNQNSGVMIFFNSTGGTFTVNGLYTSSNAGVVTGASDWVPTGSGEVNLPNLTVALFDNTNNLGTANIYTVLSGTTGLSGIPSLVDNDTNYIVVDYNDGLPKYDVLNNDTLINDSTIVLYLIIYRAGDHIHVLDFGNQGAGLPNKLNNRVIMTQRFARESGFMIGLSGNTGVVTLSSGISWNGTNRQELVAVNSAEDIFFKNFHSGGTWVYSTSASTINNTYYDNGTDLVLADAGKYLVNWYFRGQEVNDHIYEVFGSDQYDTLLDAEGSSEPQLPELITSHAFLTGRIIVQQGQFSGVTQTAFGTVFQSYGAVSVHNDLVGIQGGSNNQYYHLTSEQYTHLPYTNQGNTFVGNQQIIGGITGDSLAATSVEVASGIINSLSGVNASFTSIDSTNINTNNAIVNGLTANAVSATTYYNLPTDVYVTGGTYSNGTATFTNNTGGTFNIGGYYTGFTGGDVSGLTANTIFATTYQNLPLDVRVTGGTYIGGTATFTNNTGGTFNVIGFYTGATDVYVTGGTYSNGAATFRNNTGGTFSVTGYYTGFTGGTVNDLTATTISATTYQNLPLDVRVTGGTYSSGTATFTNNTGGTFNVVGFSTPFTGGTINGLTANTISATTYQNLPTDIRVTGGTYSSGTATFTNNTGGTFNVTGFSTANGNITGNGTVNYLPKFTGSTGISNSQIYDDGANVGIGTSIPGVKLDVIGYERTIKYIGTQQEPFSNYDNYAGDIIEGNIDGNVVKWDLVALDEDNIWYKADGDNINSTFMLGIYLDGGLVLLDGHITVHNDSGTGFGPAVKLPKNGKPIYILQPSPGLMGTDIPMGGYVRVLGHTYHNSSNDPINFVMKFRPSNDWIEL